MLTLTAAQLDQRARELLLPIEQRRAYVLLTRRLATSGRCPGCGAAVEHFESSIVTHIRRCQPLIAAATPLPAADPRLAMNATRFDRLRLAEHHGYLTDADRKELNAMRGNAPSINPFAGDTPMPKKSAPKKSTPKAAKPAAPKTPAVERQEALVAAAAAQPPAKPALMPVVTALDRALVEHHAAAATKPRAITDPRAARLLEVRRLLAIERRTKTKLNRNVIARLEQELESLEAPAPAAAPSTFADVSAQLSATTKSFAAKVAKPAPAKPAAKPAKAAKPAPVAKAASGARPVCSKCGRDNGRPAAPDCRNGAACKRRQQEAAGATA